MRPAGSPESLERRRRQAVALLAEGWQPVEVARMVGVHRRSVRRWRAAHDRLGPDGLAFRPVPGRPSKLDAAARQRLSQMLLAGARAAGFPTDLWTCARVGELIRREFGVNYHVDHLGRLLRSMGWRCRRTREDGAPEKAATAVPAVPAALGEAAVAAAASPAPEEEQQPAEVAAEPAMAS